MTSAIPFPKRVVIGARAKQQPELPTPNCTVETKTLGKLARRTIEASFDGGVISSDAGELLFRQIDDRIGLTPVVANAFGDGRRAASVTHDMCTLRTQRIYALCCGWEDVIHHDTLRHDLALQTLVGRARRWLLEQRFAAWTQRPAWPRLQHCMASFLTISWR